MGGRSGTAARTIEAAITIQLMIQHYVDGQWRRSGAPSHLTVLNPATAEELGKQKGHRSAVAEGVVARVLMSVSVARCQA